MAIEYELKFRATGDKLQAILAAFPEAHQHYDMLTTYYDTPSGALSARKYTLRHRMENENHVCTLKTPAVGNGRKEFEVSCCRVEDAEFPDAPADFAELVQEGLLAVCGAKFHRIAIPVTYGDCVLEIALDEGVLTGGGREIPLCEVEVELKSGSPRDADSFALILANQYRLTPETKSKFRRSLELYHGNPHTRPFGAPSPHL